MVSECVLIIILSSGIEWKGSSSCSCVEQNNQKVSSFLHLGDDRKMDMRRGGGGGVTSESTEKKKKDCVMTASVERNRR